MKKASKDFARACLILFSCSAATELRAEDRNITASYSFHNYNKVKLGSGNAIKLPNRKQISIKTIKTDAPIDIPGGYSFKEGTKELGKFALILYPPGRYSSPNTFFCTDSDRYNKNPEYIPTTDQGQKLTGISFDIVVNSIDKKNDKIDATCKIKTKYEGDTSIRSK